MNSNLLLYNGFVKIKPFLLLFIFSFWHAGFSVTTWNVTSNGDTLGSTDPMQANLTLRTAMTFAIAGDTIDCNVWHDRVRRVTSSSSGKREDS